MQIESQSRAPNDTFITFSKCIENGQALESGVRRVGPL